MKEHQENVDGYRLGTPVGYGAGSTIYRAVREADGSSVAIKYIDVEQKASRPNIVHHLENEYRILTTLHENGDAPASIVDVFDLCRVRKFFKLRCIYMVAELVEGDSLWEHRDCSTGKKLYILEQLCNALRYIHSRGYVHGDLKPENVLITDSLDIKLIDFGFAAAAGSVLSGVKGTWGYLAPEQAGGVLTPATDIFSLGAVMYWLFTGEQLPNIAPDENGGGFVPLDELNIAPPVHLNHEVPHEISDLIMECCAIDSGARPIAPVVCKRIHDAALRLELNDLG
jgi:serine/threonine-protein kinase